MELVWDVWHINLATDSPETPTIYANGHQYGDAELKEEDEEEEKEVEWTVAPTHNNKITFHRSNYNWRVHSLIAG